MSSTSIAPIIQLPLPSPRRAGDALRHWGGEVRSVEVAQGPWRLTRRGRATVLLLLASALSLLGMLAASVTQVAASGGAGNTGQSVIVIDPVAAESVVVRSGDTLWSIASRELPHMDPREAVVALRAVNDVGGGEIVAGQRLVLPAE